MGTEPRDAASIARAGILALTVMLSALLSLSMVRPISATNAPLQPMPLAPVAPELPLPPSPLLLPVEARQLCAESTPLMPLSPALPPALPTVPCPAPPCLPAIASPVCPPLCPQPCPPLCPPLCPPAQECPAAPTAPTAPVRGLSRPRLGKRLAERASQGPQLWGSAEFLLWNLSDYSVPPLVTTGPAQFPVGFLGNPGTGVLFGGSSLKYDVFSGWRFMAGIWFGECMRCGLEGDYFFLPEQTKSTVFHSDAVPVLARPFTNGNTGRPFSEFGAFPGIATGSMFVDTTAELWGAGVRFRKPLLGRCNSGLDLLAGFQYLSLKESLTITETPTFLPGSPFPELSGLSFIAVDRYATRNQFYGGQLGIAARHRRGNLLFDLRALIGLGSTHQEVDIQGGQRVVDPAGNVALYQGGLLALPGANIGHATRDVFSVVPQVGLNLGYQVTERLSLFVGYSFLYWSNVVRPGDQIDPVLDVTRIPNFITNATPMNPPRPINPFKQSDLWVHGVNFGLGLNW